MARNSLAKHPRLRFEEKVRRMPDGCWLWTAGIHHSGYAMFCVPVGGRSKSVFAHRFSYELYVGPIPDNLTLDHLCRVRHCVNPDHLEAVTIRENIMRSERTVAGINARKTHCPQGHSFAEHGFISAGRRYCRLCHRAKALRYYHEHQVKSVAS